MSLIDFEALIHFGTALLTELGFNEDDARWVSNNAVVSEAMGGIAHGVKQWIVHEKWVPQSVNPLSQAQVISERPGATWLKHDRGSGPLAVRKAVELAMKGVEQQGVFAVGCGATHWIGGAGSYLLPFLEAGYLAKMDVQTSVANWVAPYGGIDGRLSTNPIAFVIPTGVTPILADFSTSSMAMGKVKYLRDENKSAPYAAFQDAEGTPTNDPDVLKEGGSVFTAGGVDEGYKGYALSLWNEAIAAMTGGRCNNPDQPGTQSFLLTVYDPECFAGKSSMAQEWSRFEPYLKSSKPYTVDQGVRLPGEGALGRLAEAKEKGVELGPRAVILAGLARKYDLNWVSPH